MLLATETSGDGVRMHPPISSQPALGLATANRPQHHLVASSMVEGGWVFKINTVNKVSMALGLSQNVRSVDLVERAYKSMVHISYT